MYICLCRGITDSQIKQAVSDGRVQCMRSLNKSLGVATECGKCGRDARKVLQQSLSESPPFHSAA